jgi:putative hydrolase of the HAD superfamily
VTVTHLLFDFFGTLVEIDRTGLDPGYPLTSRALRDLAGLELGAEELGRQWRETWMRFERDNRAGHREFTLDEVWTAFLRERQGREPDPELTRTVMDIYLAEWDSGVRPLPGIEAWLRELATRFRLAIVSNTNHPDLVPGHVVAMGLDGAFDALILSVEVGRRKPHPEIYDHALQKLGAQADQTVFVGDTLDCDFHGPSAAGMRAFLIDPLRLAGVPEQCRLDSVFGLAGRLP